MKRNQQEQFLKMKRIQDASDDDLDTDIIESDKKRYVRKDNTTTDKTTEEPKEQPGKKDTKTLLYIIAAMVVFLVIFILIAKIVPHEKESKTLDELHFENLEGKLSSEQGYIYQGYSFVNFSGIWYTKIQSDDTLYDVTFNYDPRSVEDIPVEGLLSEDFVKPDKLIYITFDPTGNYRKYVAVANFGLSRSLAWAFGYNMTAGCTKNVTQACQTAGVVQCGDPDKSVIFFKEASPTKIILDGNCVTIQGEGPEIVRAKDRLLLRWYGISDDVIPFLNSN